MVDKITNFDFYTNMEIVPHSIFVPTGKEGVDPDSNCPLLAGRITFHNLTSSQIGLIKDGEATQNIDYTDRSAISQIGIDTRVDLNKIELVPNRNSASAPMEIIAYGDPALIGIIKKNGSLSMGRLILPGDSRSLTTQEIQEARSRQLLALPKNYAVDEKGQVRVPLEDIHYLLRLQNDKDRQYALKHGRRGLIGKQARIPDSNPLPAKACTVSEIKVSTGPYIGIIQRQILDDIHHLGSVLLDPMRSTGIERNGRQIELYNGRNDNVARESVAIPLRFYTDEKAVKRFGGFSLQTRERIHAEGMRPSDTLLSRPEFLSECFTDIGQIPNSTEFAGKIVSTDGATSFGWEKTYGWHKQGITEAARYGKRMHDHDTQQISHMLKHKTSENGRMLITYNLPSASHLEELSGTAGIKTFVFRGMQLQREIFDGKKDPRPERNFYLDATLHTKLMELERQGCEFIWWPRSNRGNEEPRVFYKNFFVTPDAKDRYDVFRKNGTGIAMFGSSIPDIESVMQNEINRLGENLEQLATQYGEIAILEGGGPGVMQMARKMAQEHTFLNVSFGMDFEQVGERPDFSPEALLFFRSDQIEYRQQFFEYLHTLPILNLGGKGTLFELTLSFLKTGLGSSLPIPMYLFDPMKKTDHFYDGILKQIQTITDKSMFTKPLCQPWTHNLMIPCRSADEITDHMRSFMNDPLAFWRECQVDEKHLRTAFTNHLLLCRNLQIQLPQYLQKAMKQLDVTT